jgi:hypothetical protein
MIEIHEVFDALICSVNLDGGFGFAGCTTGVVVEGLTSVPAGAGVEDGFIRFVAEA